MSKEPKIDANDALREDRLEQWRSEWIDVPELLEEPKPTEANLSELSHWLYLDIKSSQVLVSEDKAAQQFITLHPDLDFADQQAVKKEILSFLREPPCKSNVIINPRVVDAVHRMCLYTKGLDLNGYQLDIEDLNEAQTHRLIWIDDQGNEESLFPYRITQYLKKVSKSLDLDFEAAAVEFLLSCSIALGGNKLIRVNDQWTENGCLWIAQVAASGIGKSPLTQMCGGRYIAEIHRRWDEEFEASKLAWEEADAETRKELVKPKRRRISEHSLTMERLFALHNDNPEGLGMVVDELRTIIDGLNQYKKSSGNDSPKLLSLWTGQRITNPVANDDRVLQRSYVPIGGGLQTDLLARIVNPAFEADGMAARFLFHFPQRSQTVTHPKDRDAIVNSITDQEKREFSQTLQRLIDSRDGGKDQLGYIKPIELTLEAHDLLQELQFELETDSRRAGPGLREAYPKLVSYLYRMALLLHEINGHRSEKIQLSIAEKAVKALLFFTANARKAYGEAVLNRETRQARRVLQWIQDQGGHCRQRDLSNALRRQFKTRSACNRMVQQLCTNEFLAMEQDGKAGVIRLIDKTE
ncbi:MAG: DUF3987 domain-containing protein, partial [SAR324 cluster bacterium]|nr:DUF3987 domain-containing protein [SAR324 cluster bacterium]